MSYKELRYKETPSESDLFPLDKLRLIKGCIDLRLKIRRGVCTEKSCIGVGAAGGYCQ
jgi:hypothetical protein